MRRQTFSAPFVKVLVAAGVLLALGLVLYSMSGMGSPRESDRVNTIKGEFSIIPPRDWPAVVNYARPEAIYTATISMTPEKLIGRPESLTIAGFKEPPDMQKVAAAGLAPAQFQNQPAWIYMGWIKREYVWHAIFERFGTWYEINLRLNHLEDIPTSGWWPYLNSFRAHDQRGIIPTTRTTQPML